MTHTSPLTTDPESPAQPDRRRLCKALLTVPLLVSVAPITTLASLAPERKLSFYHTHTGEELSLTYHKNGSYIPAALEQINHYLRDFRCDEVHQIDPKLMDILHDLQQAAGNPNGTFEVISGYRSPETNGKLRQKSNGVAKKSLHMQGMAIDIRLDGTSTKKVRDLGMQLKRGGVGFYASSDFVHLDTGRVRHW
ncbi:MAG: Twin-arginine translocation pathway signal [Desulfuromonas sp.]|nr:MAG: Twin-arginine translocation pathway signal [Desulfuromonas sp.]